MLSDTDVQRMDQRHELRRRQAAIWHQVCQDLISCPDDQINPIFDRAQAKADELGKLIVELEVADGQ